MRLLLKLSNCLKNKMIIPEVRLVPVGDTDDAKAAIGFRYNAEAGFRHKLGGVPTRIHQKEWPICCNKAMTFYAQLDSIGDAYNLADCGLIYVFVCFDCFCTQAILHSG